MVRQSPGMGTLCDQMPAQPHKNSKDCCGESCVFQQEMASSKERSFFGIRETQKEQRELDLNLSGLEFDQLHNNKEIPNDEEQRARKNFPRK